MRCSYHPDKDAVTKCSSCGRALCSECALSEGGQTYICSRCATLSAAQDTVDGIDRRLEQKEERRQVEDEKKKKKSTRYRVFQWVIIFVCIGVIATQIPRIISAFEEDKPLRQGTYSTDEKTDLCIKNLWRISRSLQEGKLPGKDMVCPETGKRYKVSEEMGDIIVRCPNPEEHGFLEIRVSLWEPAPELVE
jgi:hypothetical protein